MEYDRGQAGAGLGQSGPCSHAVCGHAADPAGDCDGRKTRPTHHIASPGGSGGWSRSGGVPQTAPPTQCTVHHGGASLPTPHPVPAATPADCIGGASARRATSGACLQGLPAAPLSRAHCSRLPIRKAHWTVARRRHWEAMHARPDPSVASVGATPLNLEIFEVHLKVEGGASAVDQDPDWVVRGVWWGLPFPESPAVWGIGPKPALPTRRAHGRH